MHALALSYGKSKKYASSNEMKWAHFTLYVFISEYIFHEHFLIPGIWISDVRHFFSRLVRLMYNAIGWNERKVGVFFVIAHSDPFSMKRNIRYPYIYIYIYFKFIFDSDFTTRIAADEYYSVMACVAVATVRTHNDMFAINKFIHYSKWWANGWMELHARQFCMHLHTNCIWSVFCVFLENWLRFKIRGINSHTKRFCMYSTLLLLLLLPPLFFGMNSANLYNKNTNAPSRIAC